MDVRPTDVLVDVCALDELPDPGTREFRLGDDGRAFSGFVLRRGEQAYAYVNLCPHARRPLNWLPEQFLNRERNAILCTGHGALFEMETGLCVAGPCLGQNLERLECSIRDGRVMVGPTRCPDLE